MARTREQVQAAYNRKDWLSPAEFGARFGGVSAEYVRAELIAGGKVRCLNLNEDGGRPEYRIHVSELDRLREAHTVNGHLPPVHGAA